MVLILACSVLLYYTLFAPQYNLLTPFLYRPAAGARGRSVYGGRNWEGFWPDPYISGVAMELSVRGIQDAGVQAVAKHLLANKQEILCNPEYYPNGTLQFEAISSNVDDRTLREYCFILDLKVVVQILVSWLG
jgi:hypothetical protein